MSAGGAPRYARPRSATGSGHAGCRRSRPATARAPAPRPARSPTACRRGGGRSPPPARRRRRSTRKSGRARRARSMNNSIASSSNDNDGTRQVTSPATPIGSRLVARIVNSGQALSSATNTRRTHPAGARNCRAAAACRGRRKTAAGCPSWSGPAGRADPTVRATVTGTTAGSVIGARSTYHTPSRNSSASWAATSTASRVLPAPPAPVNVTSRLSATIWLHLGHFGATSDETRQLRRKVVGPNSFGRAKRRETRCGDRGGTAAPRVRGGADPATGWVPRSVSHASAGSRSTTKSLWCRITRSARRGPSRAAAPCG